MLYLQIWYVVLLCTARHFQPLRSILNQVVFYFFYTVNLSVQLGSFSLTLFMFRYNKLRCLFIDCRL